MCMVKVQSSIYLFIYLSGLFITGFRLEEVVLTLMPWLIQAT